MNENGRHEHKLSIGLSDYLQLSAKLGQIARLDENASENGGYKTRSLYFDNYTDKAVVEKLAGLSRREKFRIRFYNDDPSLIRLEKKSKANRLCYKESALLTKAQCDSILAGRFDVLKEGRHPLHWELYAKMRCQNLRPRTIVDYERKAYIYSTGNVRVTFDQNIRTSNRVTGLFDPGLVTIPAAATIVLEVKYDGFLPELIRQTVRLDGRFETEFSKYVVARFVS